MTVNYRDINDADAYQKATDETAIYPSGNVVEELSYLALGLNGEAGEVADIVKKIIRDGDGRLTPEVRDRLIDEMGDVAWYLVRLARALGIKMSVVLGRNLYKLAKRKAANTIKGSGDNR